MFIIKANIFLGVMLSKKEGEAGDKDTIGNRSAEVEET